MTAYFGFYFNRFMAALGCALSTLLIKMKGMKRRHWGIGLFGLCCLLVAVFAHAPDRFPGGTVMVQRLRGKATVTDRLSQFGPAAHTHWQPHFAKHGVAYPPQKLLLVGLKREKQLQVYAAAAGQPFHFIRALPIQGLSGKLGPKLSFGDLQVPEGFYRIESLNPNSAFQVALRVNYPNAFDRAQALKDGRTELGGDIMMHGSNASIGCLAMGDAVSEDLFVLATEVGIENIRVILSPVDFRVTDVPPNAKRPAWVTRLYGEIKVALRALPMK